MSLGWSVSRAEREWSGGVEWLWIGKKKMWLPSGGKECLHKRNRKVIRFGCVIWWSLWREPFADGSLFCLRNIWPNGGDHNGVAWLRIPAHPIRSPFGFQSSILSWIKCHDLIERWTNAPKESFVQSSMGRSWPYSIGIRQTKQGCKLFSLLVLVRSLLIYQMTIPMTRTIFFFNQSYLWNCSHEYICS